MKAYGYCVCPRDEYQFLLQHIDGPRRVRKRENVSRARRELVGKGFVEFVKPEGHATFTKLTDAGRCWLCKLLGIEADALTGYLNGYAKNPKVKITLGENHEYEYSD